MKGRYLIVNADDFGLSEGVNRGIIRAHEQGIVTSASLMVRWPAADDAAAYARRRPQLSLGLHLDLGEWVYRDGEWSKLYEVVPDDGDVERVKDELCRQLRRFRVLVGRDPTHLDSHQHVHRHAPLCTLMEEIAVQLDVPLRHFSPEVQYNGSFYGQTGKGEPYPEGIRAESLVQVVAGLPEGITELLCHPGIGCDHESPYAKEREMEVQALCDSRVKEALEAEEIRLISFKELPHAINELLRS